MGFDDGLDDDELPFRAPLPPDDRLWRHPSEVVAEASDVDDGWSQLAMPPVIRPPRAWQVALVSGLSGALLATGLSVVALDRRAGSPTRVIERVVPGTQASITGRRTDMVPDAVEDVRPAIVQLVTRVDNSGHATGGSGVLFRDDGHVLTNDHVVHGAKEIAVVTSDGRRHVGHLLGGDPDTDLAVVKIDGGPYPIATLGSATMLRTGESCIAIGSPGGLAGGPSVSVGVVSALGRTLERDAGRDLFDMIQTDAAISPGSSGGALLDLRGAVIGITTAIVVSDAGAEGLGFATPIDIARLVADQLIENGKVVHVWLGIEGADIDQADADDIDVDGGAAVHKVVDGSPAKLAGLEPGDVIVEVNGSPVPTMAALVVSLRAFRAGEVVRLTIIRNGDRRTISATLSERPAEAPS